MPFITARVVSVIRDDTIAAAAFAGIDQNVLCLSTVQLEGTVIGDDPANHTYLWVQTSGDTITIINPTTLTPWFVSPGTSDIEITFYIDKDTPFEDSDVVRISATPTDNATGGATGATAATEFGGTATVASRSTSTSFLLSEAKTAPSSWTNPPAGYSPLYEPEDVYNMRNMLGAQYWLMNDIDLSEYANWDPIGTSTKPFIGELQGNGYVIDNLTITSSTKDAGLFSHIGSGALIEEVGIIGANISGVGSSIYKGILAGVVDEATIQNCYTEGTVASGNDLAGGFVGDTGTSASSTFTNTYADVTVTGIGTDVGGWAGTFSGTPTYVENYGNTTKTASVVGTGSPGATEVAGRTTEELQARSAYDGWDFVNTWDWPEPNFSNVVLQLDMEGADESQTTFDASSYNHTVTINGTSAIDTDQSKVGSSSFRKGSIKDSVARNAAFDITDTLHWTAEAWVRFNGDPGTADTPFFAGPYHSPGNLNWLWRLNNNNMEFIMGSGTVGSIASASAAWNPVGSQWYHIAVCIERGSTDYLRMFVDGTQIGSDDATFDGLGSNGNTSAYFGLALGSYWNNAVTLSGWLDNVRIVRGEALYTEDFTPEATPFSTANPPDLGNAVALQEQDTLTVRNSTCNDTMVVWPRQEYSPNGFNIGKREYIGKGVPGDGYSIGGSRYIPKGARIEKKVGNNWVPYAQIPGNQRFFNLAQDDVVRAYWRWQQSGGGLMTKNIETLHPGMFASSDISGGTSVRPGGASAVTGGGTGTSSPVGYNIVITIQNPTKITKPQDDPVTGGGTGTSSTVSDLILNRYPNAANKTPAHDGIGVTGGATGATAVAPHSLVIDRDNGGSIGGA